MTSSDNHDEERQPLLKKSHDADLQSERRAGLPWTPVLVLALWRATHVRRARIMS